MDVELNHCKVCDHYWIKKHNFTPKFCPNCHSILWNRERKKYTFHGEHGETTKLALEIRAKMPCATLQYIAEKTGVSRERIRQVLERAKVPTKHITVPKYKCNQCGKPTNNRLFCSIDCEKEYHKIIVTCDYCGKLVERQSYKVIHNILNFNSTMNFCNKDCQGKWIGNNHGFAVHPENANRIKKGQPNLKLRKYDYDLIWQKHMETKLGCLRLSRILNIPPNEISRVMQKKRIKLGLKVTHQNRQPEFNLNLK